MYYNGGVWQKYDEKNICVCTAGFLGKQCEYSGEIYKYIKKNEFGEPEDRVWVYFVFGY